jgi:hypothetical protein
MHGPAVDAASVMRPAISSRNLAVGHWHRLPARGCRPLCLPCVARNPSAAIFVVVVSRGVAGF